MFNIKMLKAVFAPKFQLHDIRQTGDYEITTRWTMTMQFTLNRISPLQRFWDPQLQFTGVSIMGINPDNGGRELLHVLHCSICDCCWCSYDPCLREKMFSGLILWQSNA